MCLASGSQERLLTLQQCLLLHDVCRGSRVEPSSGAQAERQAALLTAGLLCLQDGHAKPYLLVFTHHSILDGWLSRLFVSEMEATHVALQFFYGIHPSGTMLCPSTVQRTFSMER